MSRCGERFRVRRRSATWSYPDAGRRGEGGAGLPRDALPVAFFNNRPGIEMGATLPADLQRLDEALDAAERDARTLVDGLTEARGAWRAESGSWTVAECLDHLAT